IIGDLRRLRFGLLPELKAHWRLSMNAIVMAAKRADALQENQVRSLFVQLSRRGFRTSEPYPLAVEEPRIVREAIRVHMNEHGYSIDELASIAGLLPNEFTQLYSPEGPLGLLRVLS